MTSPQKTWRMTELRLRRIVRDYLPEDLQSEFIDFMQIGAFHRSFEETILSIFEKGNFRFAKTKNENILILKNMMDIYVHLKENDLLSHGFVSPVRLHKLGSILKSPGSLELWCSAPQWVKFSWERLRNHNDRYYRAFYTELLLLEKLDWRKEFMLQDENVYENAVAKIRNVSAGSGLSLDLSEPSREFRKIVSEVRNLRNFTYATVAIITLMHLIYGAEKTESVISNFVYAGIEPQPDQILHILENYDELGSYPAIWLEDILTIEGLES